MFATRFGVSLENVVATREMPANHQGTERPEAKNSVVLLPERLPKASAGRKQTKMQAAAIIQSRVCKAMLACQDTLLAAQLSFVYLFFLSRGQNYPFSSEAESKIPRAAQTIYKENPCSGSNEYYFFSYCGLCSLVWLLRQISGRLTGAVPIPHAINDLSC